jgi:ElaB/YqjD/DUF883 family membrane-anchored ribosome-binding protein
MFLVSIATALTTNTESEKHMAEAGQGMQGMELENEYTEQGKLAAGRLQNALETAKVRVQEGTVAGAKATDRAIREHPYESLGVAFGLGVLIGVLIARR